MKEQEEMFFGDDTFYFIVGYTSNGVPFGITHEEMKEIERGGENHTYEIYPLPYMFDLIHYDSLSDENLENHIDNFGKELYHKKRFCGARE